MHQCIVVAAIRVVILQCLLYMFHAAEDRVVVIRGDSGGGDVGVHASVGYDGDIFMCLYVPTEINFPKLRGGKLNG